MLSYGDYNIENFLNTQRVHFKHRGIRFTVVVDVGQLLNDYISGHMTKLKMLMDLVDDPDPTKLLDDPEAQYIILFLPDPDCVPGHEISESKMREWHYHQIVSAYNTAHGTNFSVSQVRNFCAD
jgi:hypothetical protein